MSSRTEDDLPSASKILPSSDSSKPRLNFWQIWNMSFGFLGIQFGFGLQLANMSAIYAKLGAKSDQIPILWLAGPVTGLLVQPIIGAMSDRTWCRLGRRRPYFLAGAILSSAALFFMPDVPLLRIAAAMLWVLDASINVSMEPFRAFVADKLRLDQRATGFLMQSFFIGVGAAVANALPSIFEYFGVTGNAANGVPLTVQYSFKIGAVVFLLAVLWTVFTSSEYPPENLDELNAEKSKGRGFQFSPWNIFGDVAPALIEMPATMMQLAVVQFFTWMGLFCMWMFFGLATAQQLFHTTDATSPAFDRGTAFGGQTFSIYSIVCFIAALLLPMAVKMTSRKLVHALALICGGVSLLATGFIHDQTWWRCTMIGVGIAWASILSMPYTILSGALPPSRMGVYMGIFNFFIVIPEIVASLALGPVVKKLFQDDPVKVVMLGGGSMVLAALLMAIVKDVSDTPSRPVATV